MPYQRPPLPTSYQVDGSKLRVLRMRQRCTLKQFAAKAGISFGFLGQVERGARPGVSPDVFGRICDALGFTHEQGLTLLTADARRQINAAMRSAA